MIRVLVVRFAFLVIRMLEAVLRLTLRFTRGVAATETPSQTSRPPAEPAHAEPGGTIDLAFVGTRDLFEEIARRNDQAALVCVRWANGKPDASKAILLGKNTGEPALFFRGVSELIKQRGTTDVFEEGDL